MEIKHIEDAIKQTLESSKRNFKQKIDLIINLKEMDLKKTDQQLDLYVNLPHERGRKVRVCALVGAELEDNASKNCDTTVTALNFDKYQKDKV